jgi:hypothetical protein
VQPERTAVLVIASRFALASLATWRLTHLLAEEDGPGDVVLRLRARAGSGRLGGLMDCFACLSLWVAAPISVIVSNRKREVPVTWLALSGAACLLEQVTRPRESTQLSRERELELVELPG